MDDEALKLAFTRDSDYRGYNIKAWYLPQSNNGDARIELLKDGAVIRTFNYPAYKIWNLAAHFEDIVDGEIQGDDSGYRTAGSDGLGGCVMPEETKS